MNTLELKKEMKKFGTKKILLTLKKNPENDRITAVIAPINNNNNNGEIIFFDKKLIEINSKDADDHEDIMVSITNRMNNIDRDVIDNNISSLPKITEIKKKTNRNILKNIEKSSLLDNALKKSDSGGFCKTFHEILYERKRNGNLNFEIPVLDKEKKRNSVDPENTNIIVSNFNKQDRFVPNILRSNSKIGENHSNNNNNDNNQVDNAQLQVTADDKITENNNYCKDEKSMKRKRKQVLSSLDTRCDLARRSKIKDRKNGLNKTLLRIKNHHKLAKKYQTEIPEITRIKSEGDSNVNCSEMISESLETLEKRRINHSDCSRDCQDLSDSENLDISYETHDYKKKNCYHSDCSRDCNDPCDSENREISYETGDNLSTKENKKMRDVNFIDDKSIRNILAEFEVADYRNYIHSEDLGFDIDEMDKLLSSDIDGSSSIFLYDNKTALGYDMNGNDIDKHGSAKKIKFNKKKLKSSNNVTSKIESYGTKRKIDDNYSGILKCDVNRDGICSRTWFDGKNYRQFKQNSWSDEKSEDHYPCSDDFQEFNRTLAAEGYSSSTDTASECESTNEDNSTAQSSRFVLSKNENTRCLASSITVTDVIPDDVFDDNSKDCCSLKDSESAQNDPVERSLDSNPMMQRYHHLNSNHINDNIYSTSLLGIEAQTSNESDTDFKLFEDGNFLGDDILNMNYTVCKEDETCESILANSNAKFDEKHILFNMNSNFSDIDIENADDIEISKLLKLRNEYIVPTVSDVTLQSGIPNSCDNELSIDTVSQLDENNILISNHVHNSQFGIMKFENPMQEEADNGFLNESTYLKGMEDLQFSFENQVETIEQEWKTDDGDFEPSDSGITNIESKNERELPLSLLCDAETKDLDSTRSSNGCSPSLGEIERRNVDELEPSKLEKLLTEPRNCMEYQSAHCLSSTGGSLMTDLENSVNEHCSSEIMEYNSEIDTSDSTITCCECCHGDPATGYEDVEDASCCCAQKERNMNDQNLNLNNLDDDDYSVAERRNHHLGKCDLPHNHQDPQNCRIISYSESLLKPAAKREISVNLKKRREGVWEELKKRSKHATKYINYNILCDFCGKKYSSEADLVDHIKVTHRYRPSRYRYRSVKKYVCDKCSKEYCLPGAIEKHFTLHENYLLTCRVCEKHFSEKVYLKRHVYSCHLDWNKECNYCSRKFSRKNELTHHMKKCHGITNHSSESHP